MTEVSAPLIYVQLRATYVPQCGLVLMQKWQVPKHLDVKGRLISGTLCKTNLCSRVSKRRTLATLLMRRVIVCSQSKVYKRFCPRRSESSNSMTVLNTCRNLESRNFWPLGYQIPHKTYNEEHLFTVYPDLDKTTVGKSKIWPPTLTTGGQENRRWLIYYKLQTMRVQFDRAIYKFSTVNRPRLCVHFIDIVTSAIYWAG